MSQIPGSRRWDWRGATQALLAAAMLVLGPACSTVYEGKLDPAKFRMSGHASAPLVAGRVALVVSAVDGEQSRLVGGFGHGMPKVRVPIGRIVEAALLASLSTEFDGGAEQYDALPSAGGGFVALAVLRNVQADYDNQLKVLVPILTPPLLYSQHQFSVRVAFDLEFRDARGHSLGTRHYGPDPAIWDESSFSLESRVAAVVRLTHEAAARGALEAARDLRDALQWERMKPRAL